jgi:putative ABC transport system substrate-binding protein
MNRRPWLTAVGVTLGLVLLAVPLAVQAQPAGKVARIGFLRAGEAPVSYMDGLRQGLREAGFVEGRHYTIEPGIVADAAQLPATAASLIARRVDVVIASGTPSVLPAKNATGNVPVVFVAAIDPVAAGVVASLARPGGHVTGITAVHADVTGKRLSLLRELIPRASRIALLVRAPSPATPQYVREAEQAARTLNLTLQVLSVPDAAGLDPAFRSAQGASAMLVVDDAVWTTHRAHIADLAIKHRLPTMYGLREMVSVGGLMAYGPDYGQMYRRAAVLVHKLLNGARPADLPVEQPTKFELVVNLTTAKAIGLTIPAAVLAQTDQVFE